MLDWILAATIHTNWSLLIMCAGTPAKDHYNSLKEIKKKFSHALPPPGTESWQKEIFITADVWLIYQVLK